MQPLKTAEDVLRYFQDNKTPIFFVITSNYNLINIKYYINNIKNINTEDPFDGRNPRRFRPCSVALECPRADRGGEQPLAEPPRGG
jgi:hypothetical protein